MKNAKFLIIMTIMSFSLIFISSCSFLDEFYPQITVECNHVAITDYGVEPTCTESGLTEGSHCSLCDKTLKVQNTISPLGHKEIIDEAVEPTCEISGLTEGKHCTLCGESTVAQETVPPLGHIEEIVEEKTIATCTEKGSTETIKCIRCEKTVKAPAFYIEKHSTVDHKCTVCEFDFTNTDLYRGSYWYNYLGTLENGKKLQTFYDALYEIISKFHSDTSIVIAEENIKLSGGKNYYLLDSVPYASHGITYDEAYLIYYMLQKDCPLFYWINNTLWYDKRSGVVWPSCIEEYGNGVDREKTNDMIYDAIEEYAYSVETETNAYNIALGYHDLIIKSIDYAYNEQDEPLMEHWTGSIIGVFDKRGAVCEGFSEALHLLLNFSGVENTYIEGAPEDEIGHAWNIVRLDDGNWYWIDITWDDRPLSKDENLTEAPYVYFPHGIGYQFFCVNDTQYVDMYDGYDSGKYEQTFMTYHEKYKAYHGLTFPARSETVYKSDDVLELRETFTVDGCTYALIGYKKVQLVSVVGRKELIVPESVVYNNVSYDVIAIGAMNDNGIIDYSKAITDDTFKITVPKNVEYIWKYALKSVPNVIFQ